MIEHKFISQFGIALHRLCEGNVNRFDMNRHNSIINRFRWPVALAIGVIVWSHHSNVSAAVIDLGTPGNASDWLVTGAGAVGAPAFDTSQTFPGDISLSDNGLPTGNYVTGASFAQFNGFWYVENSFELPANATNVSFDFNGLWGNDRVVMSLNGTQIGNATFGGGTGSGLMRFEESGSDLPFTFTETTSGTITSGFVIGGTNTLRLTVNNTGVNLAAPTIPSAFPEDSTTVYLASGTVAYTAIPEPSCAIALLASTFVFAARRRRSI